MGKDASYIVQLTADERDQLQAMVDRGARSKETRRRARVLFEADRSSGRERVLDADVAARAQVSTRTVARLRKRFVEEGFEAAVFHRANTDRLYRKLDGQGEAVLIATACSEPPEGRCRWTLKLLSAKLVALEVVDSISQECVRGTLKKTGYALT